MKKIDLHIHTTSSDGTLSPSEVVAEALRLGLSAIAVTDHDTAHGCAEAAEAAAGSGLEVVPGIEISTKHSGPVHILGYFVDASHPVMSEALDWIVRDRDERNEKMCELMRADGIDVDYGAMRERFGEVIGRPHFARLLVERGLARDVKDAFDKYVEKGRKYYQGRSFLPLERSVGIIREAGGTAVLAHPFQYRLDDAGLRGLIERCLDCGLGGIECRYSGYDEDMTAYLESLAREYGLVRTGGSDFHGSNKPEISIGSGKGSLSVPCEYLEELKSRRGK